MHDPDHAGINILCSVGIVTEVLVGASLVQHPSVAKIAVTGDIATGQAVLAQASPGPSCLAPCGMH
ncbi:MAG: hypothetical protein C7B46_02635 [Sulfobacillus benefaciens]|uniref:Uncharacterized protein n=1 Tax=Sulfobacillus benefaciens TaxID=453960 RepID=A0A2T2XKQ0_9FIRM|nr:MAG: hypothetical protein C7B46_02635 [Sulfobacillus benefaciens]